MADTYDRYDNEGSGAGGFMMGLLTGTVLGAGLGMLLAPKSGSELRGAIGEQARNLGEQARTWGTTAQEQYKKASDTAGQWAERGKDLVDKARDAVTRTAEEARGYSTGSSSYGGPTTPGTGGSDFGRS
jgi:gas vesicle protein